jgi:hypothetical protein
MTTTTLSNGKRISLTIEQKARLLTVITEHPELAANELAVTSGTIFGSAYVVTHNGKHSIHCTCGAYIAGCAHRVAVDWHLETQEQAHRDEVETQRINREMMYSPY